MAVKSAEPMATLCPDAFDVHLVQIQYQESTGIVDLSISNYFDIAKYGNVEGQL